MLVVNTPCKSPGSPGDFGPCAAPVMVWPHVSHGATGGGRQLLNYLSSPYIRRLQTLIFPMGMLPQRLPGGTDPPHAASSPHTFLIASDGVAQP